MFQRLFFILLLFGFLLLTNRYLSCDEAIQILQANDICSYLEIAKAAPGFPSSTTQIPFHRAQRWIVPFLVGILAKASGVSVESLFWGVALFSLLFIVRELFKLLDFWEIPEEHSLLCLAMVLWHPWMSRYYLAAPVMASTDLIFCAGLICMLRGLATQRIPSVVAGAVLGLIGKQTMIFLLPGILFWLLTDKDRQKYPLKKRMAVSGVLGIVMACVLALTAWGANRFVDAGMDAGVHIFGIIPWVPYQFSFKAMIEFVVRGIFPLLLPIGILAGLHIGKPSLPSRAYVRCWIFAGLICAQPFMASPDEYGMSITRLNSFALLPLLLAVALQLKQIQLRLSPATTLLCGAIIAASSLHHKVTYHGLSESASATLSGLAAGDPVARAASRFFLIYVLAALGLGLLFLLEAGKQRPCGCIKRTISLS
jgi:hypothetical protein